MALLGAIILLEVWPMATFIRWRAVVRRGGTPDTGRARQLWVVNHVELVLAVAIVFVASFMARGFGPR
jgi:putative membrane protein